MPKPCWAHLLDLNWLTKINFGQLTKRWTHSYDINHTTITRAVPQTIYDHLFWFLNGQYSVTNIWYFITKKKWKREKNIFVDKEQGKNVKKLYVNIEHSVHWVSPPISKSPPHSFLPTSPLRSTNCPTRSPFRWLHPSILFFCEHPLKVGIYSESPKCWSFSSLTPSYLLKVTRFLVKISQFEF